MVDFKRLLRARILESLQHMTHLTQEQREQRADEMLAARLAQQAEEPGSRARAEADADILAPAADDTGAAGRAFLRGQESGRRQSTQPNPAGNGPKGR